MADKKTKTPTKKRRLGRGLGSLISAPVAVDPPASPNTADTRDRSSESNDADPNRQSTPASDSASLTNDRAESNESTTESSSSIRNLPLDAIVANRSQPRQVFNEETLESLANSIRTAGVMQPILVREVGKGEYELIAGERRLRAAQRIPLERIPAIIHEIDDVTAAEWALIENLQREDLNPMDRAEAFERLIEDHQMSHGELAERVGLIRSSVSNIVRLNDLDPDTKAEVRDGTLSASQGKALLAVGSIPDRRRLAKTAIARGWSVRELEKRAAITGKQEPGGKDKSRALAAAAKAKSPHLEDLEQKLGEHLGTRVHIHAGRKKGTGKIILEFYTLDEFDGLMQAMDFEPGGGD